MSLLLITIEGEFAVGGVLSTTVLLLTVEEVTVSAASEGYEPQSNSAPDITMIVPQYLISRHPQAEAPTPAARP
jgi:hypothetical protein|tara:strand:+ start:1267 stop:1488 length:222 start_codon:yes stop_codon:yes gene_type:complete